MLTPLKVETIARITEQFAQTCFNNDYGCVQYIGYYVVVPVLRDDDNERLSPYVEKRQQETNSFIRKFRDG